MASPSNGIVSSKLQNSIVRVLRDGAPVGGGVLVVDHGHAQILTASHVVNLASGHLANTRQRPSEELAIDFPFLESGPIKASVEKWSLPSARGHVKVPTGGQRKSPLC